MSRLLCGIIPRGTVLKRRLRKTHNKEWVEHKLLENFVLRPSHLLYETQDFFIYFHRQYSYKVRKDWIVS